MARENTTSKQRAAELVRLYHERLNERAIQCVRTSSALSVVLSVTTDGKMHCFALKAIPTRISLASRQTTEAFQQHDGYIPNPLVACQAIAWKAGTPWTTKDSSGAAGGKDLLCEVDRCSDDANAQPMHCTLNGELTWDGCATKVITSEHGWTLHFTYASTEGVLRLVSADHDSRVAQSSLQTLRDLTIPVDPPKRKVTKRKTEEEEDDTEQRKKQQTQATTTAPSTPARRY